MNVMIEFNGGPHYGKTLAAGEDPEFDAVKAKCILFAISSGLNAAAKREDPPGTLLIWRAPSPEMSKKAKEESWSAHKIKALMKYHVYHIDRYQEAGDVLLFTADYQGEE